MIETRVLIRGGSDFSGVFSGPILGRTCVQFIRERAKTGKLFKNLNKNVQNLTIF